MKRDYWPTKHWQEAAPESFGMNADLLAKADTVIKAQFPTINSVIVARQGYIVFERYYHGCDPGMSHHVTSVTKSVTSALIGIAIDRGSISGVEQRVLDFFPEYSSGPHETLKREIQYTVRPEPVEGLLMLRRLSTNGRFPHRCGNLTLSR